MSWTLRLDELARFVAPDVRWRDVWAVIARGERSDKGRDWSTGLLWSLKRNAWLVDLDDDPTTCRACGGRITGGHALALYCSTACRKVAFRCRSKGTSTPWAQTAAEARAALADWRRQVDLAHRTVRRWERKAEGPLVISPPDWTRFDHLPVLPERCEDRCGGACPHTGGGVCLYASTAVEDLDHE